MQIMETPSKNYILINHNLIKQQQVCQFNQSQDILVKQYAEQSYLIIKNGKNIVQHLHFFASHKYHIISYGQADILNQISNMNILRNYANQKFLILNIYGIISPSKSNQKSPEREKQIKQINQNINIFEVDILKLDSQNIVQLLQKQFGKQSHSSSYILSLQQQNIHQKLNEVSLVRVSPQNIKLSLQEIKNKINQKFLQEYKPILKNNQYMEIQQKFQTWTIPTQLTQKKLTQGIIKMYLLRQNKDIWRARRQAQKVFQKKSLQQMVYNPLTLRMVCIVLHEVNKLNIPNKFSVYQVFMRDWFQKQQKKRQVKLHNAAQYQSYFYQLAFDMFLSNKTQADINDLNKWNKYSNTLKKGLPLQFNQEKCLFIHRSFLQFGVAKQILKLIKNKQFYYHPKLLMKSKNIAQRLRQNLQSNPNDYYTLMNIVEQSKTNKSFQNSAAAAISLINVFYPSFCGLDLSNISIPHADLTYAFFENTNLNNSNLKNVIFDKSYCVGTKFNKADLRNAKFGVFPDIQFGQTVNCIDIKSIKRNRQYIVAGGASGKIGIYNLSNLRVIRQWTSGNNIKSIKWSFDGKTIITGHANNNYIIWNSESGRNMKTLSGLNTNISSISYSTDNKRIASGSSDNSIKIIDIQIGVIISSLTGHTAAVSSVCHSVDGTKLISGSSDNTIKIWDLQNGKIINSLADHKNIVSSVCYSNDNSKIISGSTDNTVKIWNAQNGEIIKTLNDHTANVSSVNFSIDQKKIVSGSHDKKIRIWDIQTGKCLYILSGHAKQISSVYFSSDQKKIISSGNDNNIKIWDIQNLQSHQTEQNDHKKRIMRSYDRKIKVSVAQKMEQLVGVRVPFQTKFVHVNNSNSKIYISSTADTIIIYDIKLKKIEKICDMSAEDRDVFFDNQKNAQNVRSSFSLMMRMAQPQISIQSIDMVDIKCNGHTRKLFQQRNKKR